MRLDRQCFIGRNADFHSICEAIYEYMDRHFDIGYTSRRLKLILYSFL